MICRLCAVFVLGLFLAPLSAADPAPVVSHKADPAAVQRYGAGYRYPQAGWVYLHIEGDPYPRGYQHGRLLAPEIAAHVRSLAISSSPKAPSNGWRHTRLLANAVFLRKFEREYLEEMKGIADGAADAGATFDGRRIDLLDIVALNVWLEIDCLAPALGVTPTGLEGLKFPKPDPMPPVRPAPEEPVARKADHCSAFIATGPATADGKIVFGHITMFSLQTGAFVNVWIDVKPTKGHRVAMQAFPGGIWSSQDYYMNSNGVLLAETTIDQTPFEIDSVPLASRARQAIQYSDSIDDVVKYLTTKNNGLYTNEWLIGDTKTNEIAMYELGTKTAKLYRSGKKDWFGDTAGFYWGCNNAKDPAVRNEAYPGDRGWRPDGRDRAWQQEFTQGGGGKIDAAWGLKVFSNPRLALSSSLDAKVTTSDMVPHLATHALYGPPTGIVWRPRPGMEVDFPEIKPLVPHPWTILTGAGVPTDDPKVKAVDFSDRVPTEVPTLKLRASPEGAAMPASPWAGSLSPATDDDLWLTAGLAAYGPIASLEAGKASPTTDRQAAAAVYRYRSMWTTAKAATPADGPNGKPADADRPRWTREQTGFGVIALRDLRQHVGAKEFDKAATAFVAANSGKPVTAAAFLTELQKATDKDAAAFLKDRKPAAAAAFTTHSFWDEPDRCVIVYGTEDDAAANRQTANDLATRFARTKGAKPTVTTDKEVTDETLAGKHVILIGRPSTNKVTRQLTAAVPVTFGTNTVTVGGDLYANAETLVIAAGANPKNPRYSVTVVAGLSGAATFLAPEVLTGTAPASEVLVCPAAARVRPVVLTKAG